MANRLIRISTLTETLGISRVTLWRWQRDGALPAPVRRFDGSILGWIEADIDAWMESRKG